MKWIMWSGVLGDPDLRLPPDVVDVSPELLEVTEGGDVDALGGARLECTLHFDFALGRDRPIERYARPAQNRLKPS